MKTTVSISDTIIVDGGTYVENLVLSGKPFVIGSKVLITGDTSEMSLNKYQ